VTAARYEAGLRQRGHQIDLVETGPGEEFPREKLSSFSPDIIHLLHAYRTGQPFLSGREESAIPFVVTMTGTDMYRDLDAVQEGPIIRRVLDEAAAVLIQNPLCVQEMASAFPTLAAKIRYLPPGIVFGNAPYAVRERHKIPFSSPFFLHPAGIRPIKRNLELLLLLGHLAEAGTPFRVAFCGPPLDAEYSRAFFSALPSRPWAVYLGVIPPAAMAAVLREADVVLNHSENEGLPNTLIEAAVLGRPILARDIPGNAAAVEEGINGLLYRDDETFLHHAAQLAADPALRRLLSRPQSDRYDPRQEALLLEKTYQDILRSNS
jgi:glycosyltransferase involved in cell wall biosynthesis